MLPIVVRCYRMAADAEKKTEEEEFLLETQDVVKEWEQQLRAEGEKVGEKKGQTAVAGAAHHMLLQMYQLRFGSTPDDAVRARMQALSDPEVLIRLSNLVAIEPQEIVDRALAGTLS